MENSLKSGYHRAALSIRNSRSGSVGASHPVHDEDLADAELVLQLLGCDGHRVEVTETPERTKQELRNILRSHEVNKSPVLFFAFTSACY